MEKKVIALNNNLLKNNHTFSIKKINPFVKIAAPISTIATLSSCDTEKIIAIGGIGSLGCTLLMTGLVIIKSLKDVKHHFRMHKDNPKMFLYELGGAVTIGALALGGFAFMGVPHFGIYISSAFALLSYAFFICSHPERNSIDIAKKTIIKHGPEVLTEDCSNLIKHDNEELCRIFKIALDELRAEHKIKNNEIKKKK